MKSMTLQFGVTRQSPREDLFLMNICEKVNGGKLGLISFVDQAQFIELFQQKYKKKGTLLPQYKNIYQKIKSNLKQHQESQLSKIQEVSYEIKTISSTRQIGYRPSFNLANKSGATLFRRDSNPKDCQTFEISEKEAQNFIQDQKYNTERNIIEQKLDPQILKIQLPLKDSSINKPIITSRSETQEIFFKDDNIPILEDKQDTQTSFVKKFEKLQPIKTNFTTEISNEDRNYSATIKQWSTSKKNSHHISSLVGTIGNEENKINEKYKINDEVQEFQEQNKNVIKQQPIAQTKNQVIKKQQQRKQIPQQQSQHIKVRSHNGSVQKIYSKQNIQQQQELQQNNRNIQQQDRSEQYTLRSNHMTSESVKMDSSKHLSSQLQRQSIMKIKISADGFDQDDFNVGSQTQRVSTSNIGRFQVNPQFIRTQTNDEVITSSSNFQSIQFKSDLNGMNISDHSSKRYTLENHDINSLMPPQSSRTLTSAKRDQRSSISNVSIFEEEKKSKRSNKNNQLKIKVKRGNKRMKSHKIEGNIPEQLQNSDNVQRRLSQERLIQSDNRFEQLIDHNDFNRQQYVTNHLDYTGSSSSQNNLDSDINSHQMNIQINKIDNEKQNIIEEESFDGSLRQQQQNNRILYATQDRLRVKEDNPFQLISSSKNLGRIQVSRTPSQITPIPSSTNIGGGSSQVRKKKGQVSVHKKAQVSLLNSEQSSQKIQYNQQKSEESQIEKYTNESSTGEKTNRQKNLKQSQIKLVPPALSNTQQIRRKSSSQTPQQIIDPKKQEQLEKERLKQIEYQKQLEKLRIEKELMEQFKLDDQMPLQQKRNIIESLIQQISSQTKQKDDEIQFQVSLYNQRQEQIQNIQKNYDDRIDFHYNIVNSCYQDMDYLCENKLKLKIKDPDKINIHNVHLKFENQLNFGQRNNGNENGDDDDMLDYNNKQFAKVHNNYDPVEIDNQIQRQYQFLQETNFLKFLKKLESQYGKQIYQVNLDQPIEQDEQNIIIDEIHEEKKQYNRQITRKLTKKISQKVEMNIYQINPQKIHIIKQKKQKIQNIGKYLMEY